MTGREPIPLTDEERLAAARDAALMDAVRGLNGPDAPPLSEVLPDAVRVAELHYWASLGRMSQVKAALNAGANINETGPFGTALHGAAEGGHLAVVRLLVELGADTGIRAPHGWTAREAAVEVGHTDIAEYLAGLEK